MPAQTHPRLDNSMKNKFMLPAHADNDSNDDDNELSSSFSTLLLNLPYADADARQLSREVSEGMKRPRRGAPGFGGGGGGGQGRPWESGEGRTGNHGMGVPRGSWGGGSTEGVGWGGREAMGFGVGGAGKAMR